MKNKGTKWVPCLFNKEQKQIRIKTSNDSLQVSAKNPMEFLRRFVRIVKTCIYYCNSRQDNESSIVNWIRRGQNALYPIESS